MTEETLRSHYSQMPDDPAAERRLGDLITSLAAAPAGRRRVLLPVVAAAGLVVGVAGVSYGLSQRGSDGSSAPPVASGSTSPVAIAPPYPVTTSVSPSASGPAPAQCATVIKTVHNRDGSTTQTIRFESFTVTRILPPRGFNPLTASAAQLEEFGFRPRPTDRAQLAAWEKEYADYQRTSHDLWCSNPAVINTGPLPVSSPSAGASTPSGR